MTHKRSKEAAANRIADLTASISDLESSIESKRNQISIITATEFQPAKAQFDADYARAIAAFDRLNPETLARHLEEKVNEKKSESEAILTSIESGSTTDAVLESYLTARKRFHVLDLAHREVKQAVAMQGRRQPSSPPPPSLSARVQPGPGSASSSPPPPPLYVALGELNLGGSSARGQLQPPAAYKAAPANTLPTYPPPAVTYMGPTAGYQQAMPVPRAPSTR